MTHRLDLPGERYAFKRVKSDAAAAGREFEITLDQFAVACHLPCHYCGRSDRNKLSIRSKSSKGGWVVKDSRYTGLDRVDNSIGYTYENCVPCCAVCNRAKNSMGYNEFIEYLTDLINFRTTGEQNDNYQGRHVRAVPLPVQGRGSEAGNEDSLEFSEGSNVSQTRDDSRKDSNDLPVQGESEVLLSWRYAMYFKEEESDKA